MTRGQTANFARRLLGNGVKLDAVVALHELLKDHRPEDIAEIALAVSRSEGESQQLEKNANLR